MFRLTRMGWTSAAVAVILSGLLIGTTGIAAEGEKPRYRARREEESV